MGAVLDGRGVLPPLLEFPVHPGPVPPEPRSRSRSPAAVRTLHRVPPGVGPFKKKTGPPPGAQASEDRRHALQKWVRITASACPGRDCLDEESIQDILVNKATGTLHLRANSLLAYEKWARVANAQAYPLSEAVAYDYVRHLSAAKAAPTKASGFRQATAFLGGLFQAEGAFTVVESSRVAGSAQTSYLRKRPTKQSQAFPSAGVAAMETAVADVSGSSGFSWEERVFLGFMLFIIHARTRFADAARVCNEPWLDLDSSGSGFIEVGATELKTGRGRARLRRVLPVVGHARGLTDSPWAEAWLALRADVGLDASLGGTLMPVPLLGGGFGCSRMLSSEGCSWLRRLLPRVSPAFGDVSIYGTHSAKATLLSWMAKAGCSDHDRRLLGGHATQGDTSLLEYSRDALAGPLYRLHRVLRLVGNGTFNPDETRSGRWLFGGPSEGLDAEQTREVSSSAVLPVRRTCPSCSHDVDGFSEFSTCSVCDRLCHAGFPCCNECHSCAVLLCAPCRRRGAHVCEPAAEDATCRESSTASSSSSSGSSSPSEEGSPAEASPGLVTDDGLDEDESRPPIPEEGLWLSRRTGVVHVASASDDSLTACGLQMSLVDVERRWSWPRDSRRCRHRGCFSAM